jgi:hypothetical protein
MVLSDNSRNCGSASKCGNCNLSLVCPKSPYCCIKNTGGGSSGDIKTLLSAISAENKLLSEGFSVLEQNLTNLISQIQDLKQTMIKNSTEINDQLNSVETKIDSLSFKDSTVDADADIPAVETVLDEGLVPYTSSDDVEEDKVLVEKKGLFGRSKWVEK